MESNFIHDFWLVQDVQPEKRGLWKRQSPSQRKWKIQKPQKELKVRTGLGKVKQRGDGTHTAVGQHVRH